LDPTREVRVGRDMETSPDKLRYYLVMQDPGVWGVPRKCEEADAVTLCGGLPDQGRDLFQRSDDHWSQFPTPIGILRQLRCLPRLQFYRSGLLLIPAQLPCFACGNHDGIIS